MAQATKSKRRFAFATNIRPFPERIFRMIRLRTSLALLLGLCAAAQAATINTTLTVDATGALSVTTGTFTANGTATLTNIGSGTFAGSVSVSAITGTNVNAPFTI